METSSRITVPVPCQEEWSKMNPSSNGRHCDNCCKTVVDFTGWTVQNIADYLKKRRSEHICGRFRANQLNVTIPYTSEQWVQQVARTPFSYSQKIALLFLLAFGMLMSSCVMGESEYEEHIIGDTVLAAPPPPPPAVMGRPQVPIITEKDSVSHKQAQFR